VRSQEGAYTDDGIARVRDALDEVALREPEFFTGGSVTIESSGATAFGRIIGRADLGQPDSSISRRRSVSSRRFARVWACMRWAARKSRYDPLHRSQTISVFSDVQDEEVRGGSPPIQPA
jgi:hypothetical protein